MTRSPLVFAALALLTWTQPAFAQATPAPATSAAGNEEVARVGDQILRMKDLEDFWRDEDPVNFARMRQQVYDSNRRVLDSLIGERLLDIEAKKRGVTKEELLAKELPRFSTPINDAEIAALYEQAKAQFNGASLDQMKPAIIKYLEQQRPAELKRKYVDELRAANSNISVTLPAPRYEVKVDSTDPVRGAASAKVEIVEFSDFECPFCGRTTPVLAQIRAKFGDQVRLIFKDYPLPNHPNAMPSAEAAQCAHEQGKFWEYHDRLFTSQQALGSDALKKYAGELGMDAAAFATCLDSRKYKERIEADVAQGNSYGVSSTPTVFINGRLIIGAAPYEAFEQVVKEELQKK